jgi:serine/threonine-protein kinase
MLALAYREPRAQRTLRYRRRALREWLASAAPRWFDRSVAAARARETQVTLSKAGHVGEAIAQRLTVALADRYRIERELGAGAMATVYLAEDLKHHRKVAVKVLKPDLAAVLGAERFLREITVTATLQHPHILPLFDSGQAVSATPNVIGGDVFLYYVMPYIEGETLRDRLKRERQLAVDDAVAIAKTIAAALDFAHRSGIIHRDIKPENILLQDGVAVVADFGIAVAEKSAGGERLTETGLSIGTPAYMSPEQIAGERDLDARSDVYALACVTYEMLAGDPPFTASNPQAVMAKHITDPAPPITTTRPNVTAGLARALAKALSKSPADRHASAAAFATGLTTEIAPADRSPPSLVVLPFANQSPDPNNEYFVDGLTEEVIAELSRLRGLSVISRNSAMTLKGTKKDTPTIARELKVSHVVTGSVRRAGDALRVTAELVDASCDKSIWSDRYTGTTADVFGIQEEIAHKIVGALEVKLTVREAREVGERPIENVVAYDCYLRARQEMDAWLPGSLDRAAKLVDHALGIVGENPLLLATKGQILWYYVNVMVSPDERYLDQADALAKRALTIDPDHYFAIYLRGIVAGLRGQTERALIDLHRARDLRPGDSNILSNVCRFTQAAGLNNLWPFVNEAIRIDPLYPIAWFGPAFTNHLYGHLQEAVPAARRAVELAGSISPLHIYSAWILASAGLRDEAKDLLRRTGADLAGSLNGSWASFLLHALEGDAEGAKAHESPELTKAASLVESAARIMNGAYALLGRRDDAIEWTRIAISRGFINYPFLATHDPFLESVRQDRRFQSLMVELRPRWEAIVEWERSLTS